MQLNMLNKGLIEMREIDIGQMGTMKMPEFILFFFSHQIALLFYRYHF